MPFWQELALLLSIALVLAIGIKALFVQAFYIPSGSMNDTLVFNDRILVQKVSYWGSASPERGDIVVFRDPGGWLDQPDEPTPVVRALQVVGLSPEGGHLVKRVIGVAGDEVRCCDARGRTLVNGTPLDEPYLADPAANGVPTFQATVPRGRVWVQGDNRGDSEDSRLQMDSPSGGFVPVDLVVGRVWARIWPLDRFGAPESTVAFEDVPAPGRD